MLNNSRDLVRKRFCSHSCRASYWGRRRDLTALWTAGSTPAANAKKGRKLEEHPRWREVGSRRITRHGYVEIKCPDNEWRYEHRVVAGCGAGQVVHHGNEVQTDNRKENLVPMTNSEHLRWHNIMRQVRKCL